MCAGAFEIYDDPQCRPEKLEDFFESGINESVDYSIAGSSEFGRYSKSDSEESEDGSDNERYVVRVNFVLHDALGPVYQQIENIAEN